MGLSKSKFYLVADPKKCAGCSSCMMTCSLAHEGKTTPSLSRIQVSGDTFARYPADISMGFCRQCADAPCYEACPLPGEALCIDPQTGVRYVDRGKCIGCGQCVTACPYHPAAIALDPVTNTAFKCDLCRHAAHWDANRGPVCVAVCPMKALRLNNEAPATPEGYFVNLRGEGWAKLKFPVD